MSCSKLSGMSSLERKFQLLQFVNDIQLTCKDQAAFGLHWPIASERSVDLFCLLLNEAYPMQWSSSQEKYIKDCLCVDDEYDVERIIKNLQTVIMVMDRS